MAKRPSYRSIRVDEDTYDTLLMVAWIRHQMNDKHFTVENIVAEVVGEANYRPDYDSDTEDYERWSELELQWDEVKEKVHDRHGYLRRLIEFR